VITSPVVGVFRRSAGSPAEPVLDLGDAVTSGQVVGAVEAMGMLNRVQSERAGVVQEVLVREGQPVEYGQPLLVVREP
jgi:acetyl-CoA carboxylase biotin carboxyl carrier protein